jgi:3',5'-cyclic AMP phosphodiesterase CpdA
VAARILHVSDAHIGRGEDLAPLLAIRELGARLEPELLVTTGDMTHRGRPEQLQRSAEILRGLGLPLFAVPGNHDIPYTFPARFTRTFEQWERAFGHPQPLYSSDSLVVVGLNSVRPWLHQGGALEDDQLELAATRLSEAPAGAYRVIALHHHLAAPPWPKASKKPLRDRDRVLRAFAAAGAELVLAGHVHQAAVAERREFEALEGESHRTLVLATAPGIGRPRPNRRGETRGANVYDVSAEALTVTTSLWNGNEFVEVAERRFPRGQII